MTSKERMLRALRREKPDRLPCTVHQWQGYHLEQYLGGMSALAAFQRFGMDAAIQYFEAMGQFWLPGEHPGDASHPDWTDEVEVRQRDPEALVQRHTIRTPGGMLTYKTEGNRRTTWIVEPMVKQPEDIELIARYMPVPRADQGAIGRAYDEVGEAGILRGFVWGDQAGCWQHACCLVGTQEMILAAVDDPEWTHRLLRMLCDKKLRFIEESLTGAKFDLIETGGGASSSTVISPKMHREFCLPYDRELHDALHRAGHRVSYHTCGGMMPLAETIAENGTDATETMAPKSVGGDVDAAELARRVGDRLGLIGGMDQCALLTSGTPDGVRREVHRLFAAAGAGGGYILSCADHFFDAPVENLQAYAEAARECTY
jgi:uroporphyrinogen-III decarboxylase